MDIGVFGAAEGETAAEALVQEIIASLLTAAVTQ